MLSVKSWKDRTLIQLPNFTSWSSGRYADSGIHSSSMKTKIVAATKQAFFPPMSFCIKVGFYGRRIIKRKLLRAYFTRSDSWASFRSDIQLWRPHGLNIHESIFVRWSGNKQSSHCLCWRMGSAWGKMATTTFSSCNDSIEMSRPGRFSTSYACTGV